MTQTGELTADTIEMILAEEKKPPKSEQMAVNRYLRFFPPDYSSKQMDAIIVKLLAEWKAGLAT